MASISEVRKRYRVAASSVRALEGNWRREPIREGLRVWRWPAGLLAALVLWLALIAVVGAATPIGSPGFRFHNTINQTHFHTSSVAEREQPLRRWPSAAAASKFDGGDADNAFGIKISHLVTSINADVMVLGSGCLPVITASAADRV
jgi:hypothetical protein